MFRSFIATGAVIAGVGQFLFHDGCLTVRTIVCDSLNFIGFLCAIAASAVY